MSEIQDDTTTVDEMGTSPEVEKKMLLDRAKIMGLKVSGNIGLDTLRAKIKAHIEADQKASDEEPEEPEEEEEDEEEDDAPVMKKAAKKKAVKQSKSEKERELRKKIHAEAMKLVRIRLTCLNPSKKDLPGEIFAVANKYIGTVKKYIPFDAGDVGYHVPNCIYQHLKDRKYLHIQTKKDPTRPGQIIVKTADVSEFAIEVMPMLTDGELKKLAQRQAMAAGTQVEEAASE